MSKVVILGIGNSLRGDDGVGPYIIKNLKLPITNYQLQTFDCGEMPENFLQPVIEAKPDILILVDCADFGGKPGEVKQLTPSQVIRSGLSTHSMSLKLFLDRVGEDTNAQIIVLGIQPQTIAFGEGLSEPVKNSLKDVEREIKSILETGN